MTRKDVLRRLEEEGVDPGSYDLDRSQRDEVYCLERHSSGWTYYYRERGIHRDERLFASEDDANRFFLDQVLRDPTTRLPR